MSIPQLRTERLLLRGWTDEDRAPFAALNADPRVMELLLGPLARSESDALAQRMQSRFEELGFGWWVVEAPGRAAFIGAVGITVPRFTAAFTPCVEIGWRFAAEHWGQGYATEAARAALRFGFEDAGLEEIVAFTVPHNRRSRAVMQRLGMTRREDDDFDHPLVEAGHPLLRHVLYRLRRDAWREANALSSSR